MKRGLLIFLLLLLCGCKPSLHSWASFNDLDYNTKIEILEDACEYGYSKYALDSNNPALYDVVKEHEACHAFAVRVAL